MATPEYGGAVMRTIYKDGTSEVERIVVVSADSVIGISVELLAGATGGWGIWVGGDGLLWLAGDSRYRYRPIAFECRVAGLSADEAVAGGPRVLICERVQEGT